MARLTNETLPDDEAGITITDPGAEPARPAKNAALYVIPDGGEPVLVRSMDADAQWSGVWRACAAPLKPDFREIKERYELADRVVPVAKLYIGRQKINVEVPAECLDVSKREYERLQTGKRGKRQWKDNWSGREACRKTLEKAVREHAKGAPIHIYSHLEVMRDI